MAVRYSKWADRSRCHWSPVPLCPAMCCFLLFGNWPQTGQRLAFLKRLCFLSSVWPQGFTLRAVIAFRAILGLFQKPTASRTPWLIRKPSSSRALRVSPHNSVTGFQRLLPLRFESLIMLLLTLIAQYRVLRMMDDDSVELSSTFSTIDLVPHSFEAQGSVQVRQR